jgi:hypothetical protein
MYEHKLYRMFVKGEASTLLLTLWENRNGAANDAESVAEKLSWRSSGFTASWLCLLLAVTALLAGYVLSLNFLGWLAFAGLCFFACFGLWLFLRSDSDKLFLKDLRSLGKRIHGCGTKSLHELEAQSAAHLVRKARDIIHLENHAKLAMQEGRIDGCACILDDVKSIKLNEFKPMHALFLRFCLVEEKWDSYFAKAEELEKLAAAARSSS